MSHPHIIKYSWVSIVHFLPLPFRFLAFAVTLFNSSHPRRSLSEQASSSSLDGLNLTQIDPSSSESRWQLVAIKELALGGLHLSQALSGQTANSSLRALGGTA